MTSNRFFKLNLSTGGACYINIATITHIECENNFAKVYVIGKKKPILTKEPFEHIIDILPSIISYGETLK